MCFRLCDYVFFAFIAGQTYIEQFILIALHCAIAVGISVRAGNRSARSVFVTEALCSITSSLIDNKGNLVKRRSKVNAVFTVIEGLISTKCNNHRARDIRAQLVFGLFILRGGIFYFVHLLFGLVFKFVQEPLRRYIGRCSKSCRYNDHGTVRFHFLGFACVISQLFLHNLKPAMVTW